VEYDEGSPLRSRLRVWRNVSVKMFEHGSGLVSGVGVGFGVGVGVGVS
jgi:hypothetical protein